MPRQFGLSGFAAISLAALACIGVAQAQNTRSFVSGHGSDTNPCTLVAPCRSFAQAVLSTAPKGEIAVLDTAGYGPVTITQSVSIVNPGGVEAGIAVPSGQAGILITGGSVALRGLTLEGAGVGQDGVKLTAGSRLEIIDCIIRDFTHDGIYVNPSNGTTTLSISNTIASDNGNDGIDIGPAAGSATVNGTISQTVTSNNSTDGIAIYGFNGVTRMEIAISGGISDNNSVGINVSGFINGFYAVSVRVNNFTVSNNRSYGIQNNQGSLTLSQDIFLVNDFGTGNIYDVNNVGSGELFLFNGNIMNGLNNSSNVTAGSDGTNKITILTGNPPSKVVEW